MHNEPLFPAKASASGDDNLIPLINIVFLLLVFFMVAGQIRATPEANLSLPQAALEKQPETLSVMLELNQHSELRLNGELIALTELSSRLQALNEQAPTTSAIDIALFADKRLTAAQLTKVLQPLRQLSLASVQLHTEVQTDLPATTVAGSDTL